MSLFVYKFIVTFQMFEHFTIAYHQSLLGNQRNGQGLRSYLVTVPDLESSENSFLGEKEQKL